MLKVVFIDDQRTAGIYKGYADNKDDDSKNKPSKVAVTETAVAARRAVTKTKTT